MDEAATRRAILGFLGGGLILGVGVRPGVSREKRISLLIRQARDKGPISRRIHFISGALRGTRYQGYTLVGGPRRPEQFVVRDDAFDCVTFCETVLAAAISPNPGEFDAALRTIRYHNGVVNWRERNHYFFEWGLHNIENKICSAVTMPGSIKIEKTVYWHRELGKRHFSIVVIPRTIFLSSKSMLANGDIVGFITQRPNMDYFHVGFVAFGNNGELLLRHASQSHRRVLDERMDRFAAVNRVQYVTLLRPQESASVSMNDKL